MKILHSSDWHLGRRLYGRTRYDEFEAFLEWMLLQVETHQIDVLLIAGDVFDTTTPSNRAQSLYYRFLSKVSASPCRHVVIIGGNHDSPSFLEAPKLLLTSMQIHIVGCAQENAQDEIIRLVSAEGELELLVCAVPYLRDRDLRTMEAGESIADKDQKLLLGLHEHYQTVIDAAVTLQVAEKSLKQHHVPIIGMGHLFAAGAKTTDGDGVRDLYVGNLAHVDASLFGDKLDYVALGHLHVPQRVGGNDWIRYSGSPIAMGFGEAKQQKVVLVLEFDAEFYRHAVPGPIDQIGKSLMPIGVPSFQRLEKIEADLDQIYKTLETLVLLDHSIWLEVVYNGADLVTDLRQKLETFLATKQAGIDLDSDLDGGNVIEILRIKNQRLVAEPTLSSETLEALDDLEPIDVFSRCLSAHETPEQQREVLTLCFSEILQEMQSEN